MRDIKFRAWDTNSKKMFDCSKIQDYSLEQVERLNSANDPYTKFMQYTGLKDKNGLEIYEGDIIQLYLDGKYISNYICEFKDGCFMFKEIGSDWIGRITNTDIEVIGNIYENPDLLKG